MPFVLFHDHFPEIAEAETRTLIVTEDSSVGLPPAHYSLLEMFCDESGCDCRRVFLFVVSSRKKGVEAVIAYGWESPKYYARWMRRDDPETIKQLQGPVLNLGSPQSDLAPAILKIVREVVLADPAYVERLKRHYRIFRGKIDGKLGLPPKKRMKIK